MSDKEPKVDIFVETDRNLSICGRCGMKMRTKKHDDGCIEVFLDEHIELYHKQEYEEFREKHLFKG